ncbi:MAG: nucleotide exchange factor GrpE [Alphaproteobacteria bacterium]|nr:nucleotide exchange factor GrpE [Alphaproteobacteria bacterium]
MAEENEQQTAETTPPQQQNDAEAQLAEMRDRMLRALADAENTRRRAERERQDVSQYAIARFARDMLQIADNFGRALAACPKELRDAADPQVKAVIDGVEATERQLLGTLEQYGVKMIDTSDGKFDPNRHQAIAEVPGDGKPAGSIVNVVQTGYMIGERLLRPAMVTVARKENGAAAAGIDTKV